MPTSQHVGVYGVWRVEGSLVLVRKARGPYTGLLDLADEDVAGVTLLEAGTSAGVSPLVREALRLLPGEFRR